jgi:hypothetical protein
MDVCHATEQARLHAHFRDVFGELACRDVSHLERAPRASRGRLLDELARYAHTGRFPRNRDFRASPTPYFVDAAGTRCAMAHLIESTGERAFVRRIAATANNARVRDLARDAELLAWLARAGLTLDEAARIQPAYCFLSKADVCFCNDMTGATGAIEGRVIATPMPHAVTVQIAATYGNVGAVSIGATVDTGGDAAIGDPVLAGINANVEHPPAISHAFVIHADGTLAVECLLDVPGLLKNDAIAAILSTAPPMGDQNSCTVALSEVDPTWGDSQCDKTQHGCAAGGAGGLPFVALAAAALWSRRPR